MNWLRHGTGRRTIVSTLGCNQKPPRPARVSNSSGPSFPTRSSTSPRGTNHVNMPDGRVLGHSASIPRPFHAFSETCAQCHVSDREICFLLYFDSVLGVRHRPPATVALIFAMGSVRLSSRKNKPTLRKGRSTTELVQDTV